METQGARLKAARLAAGFRTAGEAAKAHNWNPSTYRGHEAGPREISKSAAIEYSRAFGVSMKWLLTGSDETATGEKRHADGNQLSKGEALVRDAIGVRVVPVLAWSAVEQMASRNEVKISTAAISQTAIADAAAPACVFGVSVTDQSMKHPETGDGLSPGDVVIINPEAQAQPGEIVLAASKTDTEASLRRLRLDVDEATGRGKVILLPTNPNFARRVLHNEDMLFIYRAIAVVRRL